jgi:hypothetical protein
MNILLRYFPETSDQITEKVQRFIINSQCPKIRFERLRGALGISLTTECVINSSVLSNEFSFVLYVIFHEIAHQYQYSKYGEKFMEKYYYDEITAEEAGSYLHKVETPADRYAISAVKSILSNTFETTKLCPLYKSASPDFIVAHMRVIGKKVKDNNLANIEVINQMIYNSVKNLN